MQLPTSGSKTVGQPAAAHYQLRLCSDILSRIVSTTENPNLHHEERYRALLKNIETAQVFEKSEVKVWECRNCGHIVVGTKAPEVCPVCNHPQSYFEVHEENY